jgi:hypothetical protein
MHLPWIRNQGDTVGGLAWPNSWRRHLGETMQGGARRTRALLRQPFTALEALSIEFIEQQHLWVYQSRLALQSEPHLRRTGKRLLLDLAPIIRDLCPSSQPDLRTLETTTIARNLRGCQNDPALISAIGALPLSRSIQNVQWGLARKVCLVSELQLRDA